MGLRDRFIKCMIADQKPTSSLKMTSISSNRIKDSRWMFTLVLVDSGVDGELNLPDDAFLTFRDLQN